MVSNDLEECSSVVIHSGHVKISTFVAQGLKPFVVNLFGEVAIGHLCKFLGGHVFLLENRMAMYETRKEQEKIKERKIKNNINYDTPIP